MTKTSLYIGALTVGALLGIISLLFKKDSNPKTEEEESPSPQTEKKLLQEFALHHLKELQKTNPNISIQDDFPENIFPKAFKNVLLADELTDTEILDAIDAINKNFNIPPPNHPYYTDNRVTVVGNDIFINNDNALFRVKDVEIQPIIRLEKEIPEITIFEDARKIRTYVIEPRSDNPNLKDHYFHTSIRVNSNSGVQIDGYISKDPQQFERTDEGIRFQPFFLSDREDMNTKLRGKGMFQRGLHYSGIISSGNIRLVCICDDCQKSFSVEFYHAGFSEIQYFYSSNSKETLLVPYDNKLGNVPAQLQKEFDEEELKALENKLPATTDGRFEYYNSFHCPHCNYPYINFRENKDIRPNEYYVNYYINQKPISL